MAHGDVVLGSDARGREVAVAEVRPYELLDPQHERGLERLLREVGVGEVCRDERPYQLDARLRDELGSARLLEDVAVPKRRQERPDQRRQRVVVGADPHADKENTDRGPMLVISGELDHQAPHAIAAATFEQQQHNRESVTEFVEVPNRGHSLTIDSGWREAAQLCLDFVARFVT